MSDAYYHRGLTIEVDSLLPRMSIEGREVPAENLSSLLVLTDPPSVKAQKLHRYGEQLIDRSPGLQKRETALGDHLAILKKGVPEWNKWRTENPTIRPLLYDTILTKDALRVELDGVDFANAVLINADLRKQKLRGANFHEANLGAAKLHEADLTGANFCRTDLYETELPDAILTDANLQGTQLAKTNLEGAKLIRCKVYGMSAWDLKLDRAVQRDLIIRYRYRSEGESTEGSSEDQITVDDLQLAQFIYLLLNNKNIRNVIDTITSKAILILGRFTPERMKVLDALRDELRRRDFVPMLFDFEKPQSRNLTETISTLAHMARFVIADITDAKSIPQELQRIVPDLPSLPVQPIILKSQYEYGMFESFLQYNWVLAPHRYNDLEDLVQSLSDKVIAPAVAKAKEIDERREMIEQALKR